MALSDDGVPVQNANLLRDALILAHRHNLTVLSHCEDADMVGNRAVNELSLIHIFYASLDTDILQENLRYTQDAEKLIQTAVPALIRTMALTNPSGKQNSFAGNVLPSAILIECKEEKVPVSMVNAFVRPIKPEPANDYDIVRGSIQADRKSVV